MKKRLQPPTIWLVIATIALVFVGVFQCYISSQLTDITNESYAYHPPKISLTNEYVASMFVCQDTYMGTCFTIYGEAEIYNSGQSDDIALARPKNLGMQQQFETGRIIIEGNRDFIPIIPGAKPKQIPILVTLQSDENITENSSVHLNVLPNVSIFEFVHPVDKHILNEIPVLGTVNIEYIFGENTARLNSSNYNNTIQVLYFEDYYKYNKMKKDILFDYGKSAILLENPNL